jgi:uncharacterized protein YfdQ (DUF2303 family)
MNKNQNTEPVLSPIFDGGHLALYKEGQKHGAEGAYRHFVTERHGDLKNSPFLVIPNDCQVVDLRHLILPAAQAAHAFDEVDSFIDFVKYYKADVSRLYCVEGSGKFLAVIDDQQPLVQIPASRKFRGELALQKTPEWAAWSGQAEKNIGQMDFALFLEDNGRFVVKPSAADFLQVALTLEAKKGVNFKSGLRLENGDHKLLFEEDTRTTAGVKGELEIPHDFTIELKLYHGGGLVRLDGKLRYRIASGQIAFYFKFPGLENIVREYVSGIRKRVAKETGLPVWSVSQLS